MRISSDLFGAFLKCPTKCWLQAAGEAASGNAYAEWITLQSTSYRAIELERVLSETPTEEVALSPPAENLNAAKWLLTANLAVQARMNTYLLDSELRTVERAQSEGRGRQAQLIPIRFVFTNKLGADHKLLLAFDGLVLSKMTGREIEFAKIIHGDDHRAVEVRTASFYSEVRSALRELASCSPAVHRPTLS